MKSHLSLLPTSEVSLKKANIDIGQRLYGLKARMAEAANLAKGLARLGARWLTPAGTTPVRIARGCLLPCFYHPNPPSY